MAIRASAMGIVVVALVGVLGASALGAEPTIDGPIVMADNSGVYVWDGGGDAALVSDSAGQPQWSPDGTMVVLTQDGGIWIMNPDGSGGTYITFPDSGQWDDSHTFVVRDSWPAWSPDGEWVVFLRRGQVYPLPGGDTTDTWLLEQSMFKVRPDGSNLTEILTRPPDDFEWMAGPAWSPDGELITFRFDGGSHADIVTVAPDGSDWTNLTEAHRLEFSVWGLPSWSPLGDTIMFVATSADDARVEEAVWMIDRDGSNPVEVVGPVGGSISFPQLEHDGESIVYRERASGGCALYRQAIGSGNRHPVYSGPGCGAFDLWPLTAGFSDTWRSPFAADIDWLGAEGITKGCNSPANFKFCPDSHVTRGQTAAFLVRALHLTDAAEDRFVDDNDSIFEADIEKIAAAGITKGCNPPTNDRFCPDSKVTRGQMAAFLVRALGYTDDGGGDLFTDDDGSVFEGDIDRLGTAGVTKGCNPPANDLYCPDSTVTRGQMAAFLHRALG